MSIKLDLSERSHINEVDFNALGFGNIFSDHMLVCDYRDGAWQTPTITSVTPFSLDPSAKVFHYGQAIFEGMKAYKDNHEAVWLFRPQDNFDRFNLSALRMAMPTIPESIFLDGLYQLLTIEQAWVPKQTGSSLYIRPFMIATNGTLSASISTEFRFCILLSPVQSYYSEPINVKIADRYSRAANGGVGAAKTAGNYAAQFYPTHLANQAGYQQIIWTDDATHSMLEEAGTMNLFFRLNNSLITPPTSERILDGITRKSILTLAQHLGIHTEVRPITVQELIDASHTGALKEIFGSGTAAVVSTIKSFAYGDQDYPLVPLLPNESYAQQMKHALTSIQTKHTPDPFGWTFKVCG
jgi:branched-chain amino acid aminotransferase